MSILTVGSLGVVIPTETSQVVAVDGLSYSLDKGEILALVGESGCGKSIGVLALTRLTPDRSRVSGEVSYDGRDLVSLSDAELRKVRGKEIAYIFQDPMTALHPLFKVGDQVDEVLRLHTDLDKTDRKARVIELFDLVGIPAPAERAEVYPHQLSGGMRQRVMITMAIACNPKILVADEPTTALDVTVQAQILELIKDLREKLGMAVLLITHDMGVVADTADRVVVMYAGRAIETGTVRSVMIDPRHPYTTGLLAAVPGRGQWSGEQRLTGIPGSVPTITAPLESCGFAARCNYVTDRCRTEVPILEPVLGSPSRVACWRSAERSTS